MAEHDPFERALADRLASAESRIPGAAAPEPPSGRERPAWLGWAAVSVVGAGAVAAGVLFATLLNDRSGPPSGGPSEVPSAMGSASASASVQESATAVPSIEPTARPIGEITGLLAVSRDGDVWVRRADGSDLRQLTDDPEYAEAPVTWLLDGSALVISRRLNDELFSATLSLLDPADGSLTDLGVVFPAYSPQSWSPDGTLLAFGGDGAIGSGIVVLDLRDGSVRLLTNDGGHGYDAAHGPIWSPDGALIAYQAFDGTSNEVRIARLSDGTVASPAPDPSEDYPLRWVTVDGTLKLVFGSYRGTDESKFAARAWIMNPDGTELQLVADSGLGVSTDPQPESRPSPDGGWIATSCANGVCITDAGGTLPSYVIPDTQGWGLADLHLEWVPGAEYVVYATTSGLDDPRGVIMVMPLPNGEPIALTADGISESSPAWQPVPGG